MSNSRGKEPKYQTLKAKHYHNNTILSPDGTVLCRCSDKKVEWYMSRGLAKKTSDNPTVIQLTFTPKGDGESSCEYQLSDKRDMCVVCGKDSELTRHHIVEYEYRKHMPEAYKSHNSYDVVLFCSICHAKYEIEAFKIKKQLSIKYDAPINGRGWYNDVKLVKLKKAAAALIKHRSKLPLKRIEELESLLKTYVGDVELASSLLQKVAEITTIVKTEEYMSHGEGVILKVEDCQDFIEMWRSHFLEVMKPKFLHHAWTVTRGRRDI